VNCEYKLLLFTSVNFLDNWINYAIRVGISSDKTFQPPACPINTLQMPALASERIAVLFVVGWFLVTWIYPTQLNKPYILAINFSAVTAIYSRLYLRLSTPEQMIAGALIGVTEGIILTLLFYFMRLHGYDNKIKAGLDWIAENWKKMEGGIEE